MKNKELKKLSKKQLIFLLKHERQWYALAKEKLEDAEKEIKEAEKLAQDCINNKGGLFR